MDMYYDRDEEGMLIMEEEEDILEMLRVTRRSEVEVAASPKKTATTKFYLSSPPVAIVGDTDAIAAAAATTTAADRQTFQATISKPCTSRSIQTPRIVTIPPSHFRNEKELTPKNQPKKEKSKQNMNPLFSISQRRLTGMRRIWRFSKRQQNSRTPSTDDEEQSSTKRHGVDDEESLSDEEHRHRMMPGPSRNTTKVPLKSSPSPPSISSRQQVPYTFSEDTAGRIVESRSSSTWRRMGKPIKRAFHRLNCTRSKKSADDNQSMSRYGGGDDESQTHFSVSTNLRVAAIQKSMFGTPAKSPTYNANQEEFPRVSLYFDGATVEVRENLQFQRSKSMSFADLDAKDNLSVCSASLGVSFDDSYAQLVLRESASGDSPELTACSSRDGRQPRRNTYTSPTSTLNSASKSTPNITKHSSPLFHLRSDKSTPQQFEDVWNRIDSYQRHNEGSDPSYSRFDPPIMTVETKHADWSEDEGREVSPAWSNFSNENDDPASYLFPRTSQNSLEHEKVEKDIRLSILGPVLLGASSLDEDDVSVPYDEPPTPSTTTTGSPGERRVITLQASSSSSIFSVSSEESHESNPSI